MPFQAETSTVLARGADGRVAAYAAPSNEHSEGILRRSTVPGPLAAGLEAEAQRLTAGVAEALGYVGVLAIEWFVTGDPARPLIANEMAPRVHNTGHWTQDAAVTSQFENHIRAIAGWPLGATTRTADAAMINLIGHDADDWLSHLDTEGAKLHLYGKRDTRPGRKMGHVNLVSRGVDFRLGGLISDPLRAFVARLVASEGGAAWLLARIGVGRRPYARLDGAAEMHRATEGRRPSAGSRSGQQR